MLYPVESSLFLVRVIPSLIRRITQNLTQFFAHISVFVLLGGFVFISSIPLTVSVPLFCVLWLMSVVDIYEHVILDSLLILLVSILLLGGLPIYWVECFIVALVLIGYKLVIEPRLSQEFLGWGDVKLFCVTALFLPILMLPMFFVGVGVLFLFVAILFRRRAIPMAPFITISFWFSLLFKKI